MERFMGNVRSMAIGATTTIGIESQTHLSQKLATIDIGQSVASVMPAGEVFGMCLIYLSFGIAGALGGLVVSMFVKPMLKKWIENKKNKRRIKKESYDKHY